MGEIKIPAWKDTTNYSRNDEERKPTCFSTKISDLEISVLNGHIYYPGIWIMHCYRLGIECRELHVDNLEAAKEKALEIVKEQVQKWYNVLEIKPKGE